MVALRCALSYSSEPLWLSNTNEPRSPTTACARTDVVQSVHSFECVFHRSVTAGLCIVQVLEVHLLLNNSVCYPSCCIHLKLEQYTSFAPGRGALSFAPGRGTQDGSKLPQGTFGHSDCRCVATTDGAILKEKDQRVNTAVAGLDKEGGGPGGDDGGR